jgi:hypothetical protein
LEAVQDGEVIDDEVTAEEAAAAPEEELVLEYIQAAKKWVRSKRLKGKLKVRGKEEEEEVIRYFVPVRTLRITTAVARNTALTNVSHIFSKLHQIPGLQKLKTKTQAGIEEQVGGASLFYSKLQAEKAVYTLLDWEVLSVEDLERPIQEDSEDEEVRRMDNDKEAKEVKEVELIKEEDSADKTDEVLKQEALEKFFDQLGDSPLRTRSWLIDWFSDKAFVHQGRVVIVGNVLFGVLPGANSGPDGRKKAMVIGDAISEIVKGDIVTVKPSEGSRELTAFPSTYVLAVLERINKAYLESSDDTDEVVLQKPEDLS